MKTRRVMVSGLEDALRASSTCPATENKRSTGHEVAEIAKKRRTSRESIGKGRKKKLSTKKGIILINDGVGVRRMLSVFKDLLCKNKRSESTRHFCVSLHE